MPLHGDLKTFPANRSITIRQFLTYQPGGVVWRWSVVVQIGIPSAYIDAYMSLGGIFLHLNTVVLPANPAAYG